MRCIVPALACFVTAGLLVVCGGSSAEGQPSPWEACKATTPSYYAGSPVTMERAREVKAKYDAELTLQRNGQWVEVGSLYDQDGDRLEDEIGIIVHLPVVVDQTELPIRLRIPGCLEGVPVQRVTPPIVAVVPPPDLERLEASVKACLASNPDELSLKPSLLMDGDANFEEWLPITVTSDRMYKVLRKYEDMLKGHPFARHVMPSVLLDENGDRLTMTDNDGITWGMVGIAVRVPQMVDQSTLPPGQRIPDCLEGVPIQRVEEELRGDRMWPNVYWVLGEEQIE